MLKIVLQVERNIKDVSFHVFNPKIVSRYSIRHGQKIIYQYNIQSHRKLDIAMKYSAETHFYELDQLILFRPETQVSEGIRKTELESSNRAATQIAHRNDQLFIKF